MIITVSRPLTIEVSEHDGPELRLRVPGDWAVRTEFIGIDPDHEDGDTSTYTLGQFIDWEFRNRFEVCEGSASSVCMFLDVFADSDPWRIEVHPLSGGPCVLLLPWPAGGTMQVEYTGEDDRPTAWDRIRDGDW